MITRCNGGSYPSISVNTCSYISYMWYCINEFLILML
ncbi:unnamed protein product [Phytomonas sp. Hart1]|nr:unnamed protein product [Phytomonas sp. Hart1]|eukprot:CCW72300.1 unnamed protein product [Phytomonas sp. isolate Hart1]